MAADVNHLNGQRENLRDDLGDGGGGALSNVGGTRVNGDAAVHVNLDVNGCVWEIFRIPVNGEARP